MQNITAWLITLNVIWLQADLALICLEWIRRRMTRSLRLGLEIFRAMRMWRTQVLVGWLRSCLLSVSLEFSPLSSFGRYRLINQHLSLACTLLFVFGNLSHCVVVCWKRLKICWQNFALSEKFCLWNWLSHRCLTPLVCFHVGPDYDHWLQTYIPKWYCNGYSN